MTCEKKCAFKRVYYGIYPTPVRKVVCVSSVYVRGLSQVNVLN